MKGRHLLTSPPLCSNCLRFLRCLLSGRFRSFLRIYWYRGIHKELNVTFSCSLFFFSLACSVLEHFVRQHNSLLECFDSPEISMYLQSFKTPLADAVKWTQTMIGPPLCFVVKTVCSCKLIPNVPVRTCHYLLMQIPFSLFMFCFQQRRLSWLAPMKSTLAQTTTDAAIWRWRSPVFMRLFGLFGHIYIILIFNLSAVVLLQAHPRSLASSHGY